MRPVRASSLVLTDVAVSDAHPADMDGRLLCSHHLAQTALTTQFPVKTSTTRAWPTLSTSRRCVGSR